MKSIRLSLIVYFLLLLAVALGAVSFLSYGKTAEALRGKQNAARDLLRAEHEAAKRGEIQKFNNDLENQARTMVSLAQSQYDRNKAIPLFYTQSGLLGAVNSPEGQLTSILWLAESNIDRLRFELSAMAASNIVLNTEALRGEEGHSTEYYYQINTGRKMSWHSESLGNEKLIPDDKNFHRAVLEPYFDDFDFHGQNVRRVQLRAPIMKHTDVWSSFQFPFPNRPAGGRGMGGGPRPGGTDRPRPAPSQSRELPTAVFQCARSTALLDGKLADMEEDLRNFLAELDDQSRVAARRLRTSMLLISMATFVATIIGGFMLIGLGLAPLRRLGDAVSRVSESHLKLDYDGPAPPIELQPIIDRLTQALTLLRQAFDREKQSTADISHELRTPLAGLLTTIEVTLRKARSPEEYRETLGECRNLAKLMTQLVERLLTLTRIDSRSDRLRVEPVDAAEMAEQCATIVRPLARANGLNLLVHRNGAVRLSTDPDKLREVMANLMHNAVEYNRPAGTIDVSVKSADGTLDLEVKDTGVGIAPEHRERIFERFFRADPSRQATGLHAGLGLAIVRGYVELMGGTITVESEVGRGSTFHVRIPSTDPANRT